MIKTETKRPNPVKTLRLMGFDVQVQHYRMYDVPVMGGVKRYLCLEGKEMNIPRDLKPLPRGGKTVVTVFTADKVFRGVADCNISDNYNKKVGTTLCMERLERTNKVTRFTPTENLSGSV